MATLERQILHELRMHIPLMDISQTCQHTGSSRAQNLVLVLTADVRNVGRCASKANGVTEMEGDEVFSLEAANAPILCKMAMIFVMDTAALCNG